MRKVQPASQATALLSVYSEEILPVLTNK